MSDEFKSCGKLFEMAEIHPKDTPKVLNSDRDRIDVIKELAISLLKRNSLDDLLWDIALAIGALPGFEDSVVYLVEGDHLIQKAAFGLKDIGDRKLLKPIKIPLGQGIVGAVAAQQQPEIIRDTRLDPRYISDQFPGRSELTVPVVFEGNVIAVLDTESKEVDAYGADDLELLQTMANISASRIASAIAELDREKVSRELEELNAVLETRVVQRTQALEHQSEQMRFERDRLQSILNSMRDGVVCINHEMQILQMSPSAARLTGWETSVALGGT